MPDDPQVADAPQEQGSEQAASGQDFAPIMEAMASHQREVLGQIEPLTERLGAIEQRFGDEQEPAQDDDPIAELLGVGGEGDGSQQPAQYLTPEQASAAFAQVREEMRAEMHAEMARDRQAAGWSELEERYPAFTDPERQQEVASTVAAEAQAVAQELGVDPQALLDSPGFVERAYLAAQARTAAESETDTAADVPLEAGGGGAAPEPEEDPAQAILQAGSVGGNADVRKFFGG